MSNERLDLTQFKNFEDFETAPWVVSPEEAQVVIIPANHESMEEMRLYTGSMTNSMAIAKVPELIAELKKCYEEIDTFHPLHGLEVWDEDPDYSRAEWREEVADGHVTSGYWRWVSNQYLASE